MARRPTVTILAALLLAVWPLVSHPLRAESGETAAAVVIAVLGFVAGDRLARVFVWLPGLAMAAGVALAVVVTLPRSLSGGPSAPPAGYGNADGMLLLCACAGLLVSAVRLPFPYRGAAFLCAVVCVVLCGAIGAQAATACAVAFLVWFPLRRRGRAVVWQVGSGVVLAAAFAVTVLLGRGMLGRSGPLAAALSDDRLRVWRDAIHITLTHPWTGAGPGSFTVLSPTARADADLAWTHSAPLQFSSELGLVGLALFAGLVATMLVMLGRQAPVGALLLLPTTVDYVLDFPSVVLAVSVVVGAAYAVSGSGKPRFTPASP